MNDLQRAIAKRKSCDHEFAKTFDKEYEEFKIGVLLKEARKNAGLTQEALADKLNTRKSAISRIENHSLDIRLSKPPAAELAGVADVSGWLVLSSNNFLESLFQASCSYIL